VREGCSCSEIQTALQCTESENFPDAILDLAEGEVRRRKHGMSIAKETLLEVVQRASKAWEAFSHYENNRQDRERLVRLRQEMAVLKSVLDFLATFSLQDPE